MDEVVRITKVERTPKGLTSALFDTLDGMRNKTLTHEEARAVAHTARAIVSVARLELDAAKIADDMGKSLDFSTLPGLGMRQREDESVHADS